MIGTILIITGVAILMWAVIGFSIERDNDSMIKLGKEFGYDEKVWKEYCEKDEKIWGFSYPLPYEIVQERRRRLWEEYKDKLDNKDGDKGYNK